MDYKKEEDQGIINKVSAPCGSGKTYAACKRISNIHKLGVGKFLYTTPTIILGEQVRRELRGLGAQNIYCINSKNSSNLLAEVIDAFQEVNRLGSGVLIITQEELKRLPYPFFWNHPSWTLIVDELPTINQSFEICLPYSFRHISDYLEIDKELNDKFSVLKPTQAAKAFINRKARDDIDELFRPLIQSAVDNNLILTSTRHWNKVVCSGDITADKGQDLTYGNQKNKLYFLSMLSPKRFIGWDKTIILGANIEHSIMHKYWADMFAINWKDEAKILNGLRYRAYSCGAKTRLLYIQEERWSKWYSRKKVDGEPLESKYLREAAEYLKNKGGKWICVPNLDYKKQTEEIIKQDENAIIMPAIAHGLNNYDDRTGICLLGAFNLTPMHYEMLEAVGIDGIYTTRAIAHGIAHQDLMRTALRRPDNKEIVEAILPDKATAEEQARMLPGCSIGPLGGILRKVKKFPLSRADKYQKTKVTNNKILCLKHLLKEEDEVGRNRDPIPKRLLGFGSQNRPESHDIDSDAIANSAVQGELVDFTMTPRTKTKEIVSSNNTMRGFIEELYGCSKANVIEDKYDILFNVSKMKGKKREDVEYSWGFIMDFDNGDLTPEKCSRIFAQYSHTVRNSFSRSTEKPNKFHLFIPSKHKITPDQHPLIYNYLLCMLEDAGYDGKRSGLDMSKRYPESFFFLPCTNKAHPEMAFFIKNRCETRELERHSLDHLKILANLPPEPTYLEPLQYEIPANDEPPNTRDPEYAERRIEERKAEWANFPTGQGLRYLGQYKIACSIYNYTGFDFSRTEGILYSAARDSKERGRIPKYMKSMKAHFG